MNKLFIRMGHLLRGFRATALAGLLAILVLALNHAIAFAQTNAPATAALTHSQRHKIKVRNAEQAQKIQAAGGSLIADYGSYQLYDAPDLAPELATNSSVEIHDEYNVVMLNAKHLDTTQPETKALRHRMGSFKGKKMHLVQFVGPVQPQWRDELLATGVTIVSYIPENSYLVYGDAASIAKVQALAGTAPHVQWEGEYANDYKIHPRARATDSKGKPRTVGTDLFTIQLLADDEANTNTFKLLEHLKLGSVQKQRSVLHYINVVGHFDPTNLALIAAQPEVVSIQPYFQPALLCERQDQIIAGNLSNNVPTGPGYLAWLANKGFTQAQFTASGFTVDVSDSGIDEGTLKPAHFGLYVNGNTNAASRMVYARFEAATNDQFNTMVGCDGHGTINAHIIAGYDNYSNFPFADTSGFHYGLGVCPFVNVGSSVIFNPNLADGENDFLFPDYTKLQSQAYHSGARISNNSWGNQNNLGEYDATAQNYDALVRDAEPTNSMYPTNGNQEMVIVFAAGNSGTFGYKTVASPATAKNVISVGAADNVQPFGGVDRSGIGDSESSSANEVASFSSRGPCLDGRMKPDIMAPGTHVSGGVAQWSQAIPNPAGTGTADPCFNGTEVSGGPGGPYWPNNQQYYTASTGTSHAAPCVAGGCALIRQYFINNFTNPPSAAMTKAYLLNSARYLTGKTANDTLPSANQGMGEMNLGAGFDGTPRFLRDQLPGDLFTASGQVRTYTGTIVDTNKPFRVTVAWTDAPGNTTGGAFNNDLDLTVTVNGNVYKGNNFNGQYSIPGGQPDSRDNVESVFLPAGTSGGFQVTIAGTSINSVGVPNSSNALEQDFALVVYNASTAQSPMIAGAGYTVEAGTCNGGINPGEPVTVDFALQNIGSINPGTIVATLLTSDSVSTSGTQSATYNTLLPGGVVQSQPFTFTPNGACGTNINATLLLQVNGATIGTVNYILPLGAFTAGTTFAQNFDSSVTNWYTVFTTNVGPWVLTNSSFDTPPYAAYIADSATNGESDLIVSNLAIASTTAQLTFRQNYNLESSPSNSLQGYDGGTFEISMNGSPYLDILSAGGSFAAGGYNTTISQDYNSAIAGQYAWSGNSGGFITTTINLPASAAGKQVSFRWRFVADDGNATITKGWYVDTISLVDGTFGCCINSADVSISASSAPTPVVVGSNLTYTVTVANGGPNMATGIAFTDTLPTNVTFVSGPAGMVNSGGTLSYTVATLAYGASSNIVFIVVPTSGGSVTNVVSISSTSSDYNSANNSTTNIATANKAPFITLQPTNVVAIFGTNVLFVAAAGGTAPLSYQWQFNGSNIDGAILTNLVLTNIQYSQAGNYAMVASNIAGTITSTVATLTVLTPPKIVDSPLSYPPISEFKHVSQGFSVSVNSIVGLNYTLQYKTAISDTNWISILPSSAGTGSALILMDTSGMQPRRFYRVQSSSGN